jgi:hypothetical protein
MTILAPSTIPLIEDRIRMLGTVTLSAEAAYELLHRAAQSYRQEVLLEQIAKGEGDASRWAKRIIEDEKRTRPKLKYPSQLVKIEVA